MDYYENMVNYVLRHMDDKLNELADIVNNNDKIVTMDTLQYYEYNKQILQYLNEIVIYDYPFYTVTTFDDAIDVINELGNNQDDFTKLCKNYLDTNSVNMRNVAMAYLLELYETRTNDIVNLIFNNFKSKIIK